MSVIANFRLYLYIKINLMEINLPLIVFGILAVIAILAFFVYRNRKDEKEFEQEIDELDERPLHHPKDDEKKM